MLLRAYFMLRLREGAWNTWLCQDLDAVLSAWESRPEASVGVLHLGFECPNAELLEDVASAYPGRVLFTESAKHGLPRHLATASVQVGVAGELPIHLAPGEWANAAQSLLGGSPKSSRSQDVRGPDRPNAGPSRGHAYDDGWLVKFLEANPALGRVVSAAGIHDDATYYAREWCLDRLARRSLGEFRARALADNGPVDPCRWARAAPPWLIDRELGALELTVRAWNVFCGLELRTVRDLARMSRDDLFKTRNFGIKTCEDVTDAIRGALAEGPPEVSTEAGDVAAETDLGSSLRPVSQEPASTLVTLLWDSLRDLPARNREILARRIGLMGPIETLQEIGSDLALSRERIRQIVAKSLTRLLSEAGWFDLLNDKIAELRSASETPLALERAEALDPWLERCAEHASVLGRLLQLAQRASYEVLQVNGVPYFAEISQEVWDDATARAPRLLRSLAEQRPDEDASRTAVTDLLPECGREFSQLLWESVHPQCHFFEDENGIPVLHYFGEKTEACVRAVLDASERPIHFTEVASQVTDLSGREVNVGTVHNLASQVGLLFGPGKYGTERHIPFTRSELEEICQFAEGIVLSDPSIRQWHVAEILENLVEHDEFEHAGIDRYLLNIALRESNSLLYLGRMVWARRDSTEALGNRIEIRHAIVSILKDAGGPLATSEIRSRLREKRGIAFLAILPDDDLIRVGRGRWGLNDRDVPVGRADQPALVNRLAAALATKQQAIHESEIADAIETAGFPVEGLFSLADRDPRFRVSPNRYVYLAAWRHPRRESLSTAVKRVLNEAQSPLGFGDIASRVEERIGRRIDQQPLSSALQAVGAQYDREMETWSAAPDEAPDAD